MQLKPSERRWGRKTYFQPPENMIIDQIVQHKKEEVARKEKELSLNVLFDMLAGVEPPKRFRLQLSNNEGIAVIAEIKRASPVKGPLCSDFDPEVLANAYNEGGAKAISVITEQRYFCGRGEYISLVKKRVSLPVLRKDFIVSEYQLFESRALGADAVLLIVSIVDDETLKCLLRTARILGMDALVEVHCHAELNRALKAGAGMIGINNRNLKNFQVDLSTTLELAGAIPKEVFLVSESGIATREDMLRLEQAGVKAALIGETLVRDADPRRKLEELLGQLERKGA